MNPNVERAWEVDEWMVGSIGNPIVNALQYKY
jgi:hypothetical protein